jgi:hypothetical protein
MTTSAVCGIELQASLGDAGFWAPYPALKRRAWSLDILPGQAGGLPESGRRSPGATGATSGQATKAQSTPQG